MKKKSTTILMLVMLFVLIITLHHVLHAEAEPKETPVATEDIEVRDHTSMNILSGVLMRMAQ